MLDVLALSGSELLAIQQPERLFGAASSVASLYKTLARRWHPDIPGGDDAVIAHINTLHDAAERLIESGMWSAPGELRFSSGGKDYVLHYFKSFEFELGRVYLSQTRVTYVLPSENYDLATQARDVITGLRTMSDSIRRDPVKAANFSTVMTTMERYLPTIKEFYETPTGIVIMIDKPADLIRMRDLVDYCGGKLDAKHAAWMISRMLHHASYLEWADLTHNDISLDTLFVCPEHHTVCMLGGWWYAMRTNHKVKALPVRTLNVAPGDLVRTKLASPRTDVELAKLTGRELLGSAQGIHLVMDKSIPPPMVNWLRLVGGNSAMKEYEHWREHILGGSFGPRQFVKLPISAADVYPTA